MEKIATDAALYLFLIAAILLWGPLNRPADAQPVVVLGFAVDGSGPIVSSEQAIQIGRYLEEQISLPVKVRSFASENQLSLWLSRFREVDVAWLSRSVLKDTPAGELETLAGQNPSSAFLVNGSVVARQGLDLSLRQQVGRAFQSMHENPAGKALLAQIKIDASSAPVRAAATPATLENQTLPTEYGAVASPSSSALSEAQGPEVKAPATSSLSSSAGDAPDPHPTVEKITPETGKSEPIALVADTLTYDPEEDSYQAQGEVVLRQAGVELRAEEILWQAATQDAAAQGAVQLTDSGTEFYGERLQYNMATGQGQVHDGRIFVREGNFHLAGEQIEKRGQASYFAEKGSFTTCDGEVPDWKFSARDVDVTLGKYALARDVWFHIRDLPVLYAPFLRYPVKTERESGLLLPWFGYSSNKGLKTSVAWYQVIDRHLDATLYLDYLSKVGLGKGLEYRYALANQNRGKALYYNVSGFNETPDFHYLEWQHQGTLPGGWRLAADVEYANKQGFYDNFSDAADEYNREQATSTLLVSRNWDKLNLVGHARYIKDLQNESNSTQQRLPELGLSLIRQRLGGTPFYVDLESYATHFLSEDGKNSDRLYLKPSLSAVFTPGSWLEIVPRVALYQRLYETDTVSDALFDPEYSLTLAAHLVKDLEVSLWGMERLQHSIESRVGYTYLSAVSEEALPLFDQFDRIGRHNELAYALINRLTARTTAADGSKVYRELLRLRLSQDYDLDEARHNRSGNNQPFSDLRLELAVQPTENAAFYADGLIDVYGSNRLSRLDAGVSVRDAVGNSAQVNYAYRDENDAGGEVDYLALQLETPLLKPLYTRFEERYDLTNNREFEKMVGLEYRSKCWSVLLSYRSRYQQNADDDQEFMLTFSLAGLGDNQEFSSGFVSSPR